MHSKEVQWKHNYTAILPTYRSQTLSHAHTLTCKRTHTHIHTQTHNMCFSHTGTHTHKHTHVFLTYRNAHTRTHTHTHTHTYINIYVDSLVHRQFWSVQTKTAFIITKIPIIWNQKTCIIVLITLTLKHNNNMCLGLSCCCCSLGKIPLGAELAHLAKSSCHVLVCLPC